jgi:Transposase, Mutator family
VIGVREDGQKILLAVKNMGGETTEAWRAVLDDLIKRGLRRPQFLIDLPKLPLLITESADEFDAVRDAFEREIKPQGIVEQTYVHDISSIVWEILRLRRCKVVIINSAFRRALEHLLVQLLKKPGQYDYEVGR